MRRIVGFHLHSQPLVLRPQRIQLRKVLQRDRGDARNRAEEVGVFLAESRRSRRVSSDKSLPGFSPPPPGARTTHAQWPCHAEAAENTAQRSQVACCTGSSPNDHLRLRKSLPIPGAQRPGFIIPGRLQHNGGLRCRDHFGNQHQQLRCKACTSRVELMTFAILKNALRSRAMRPSPGIRGQAREIEVAR